MKIQKNVIHKTEFGCYGNWVTVIPKKIVDIKENSNYIGIEYEYVSNGQKVVMYSHKSEIDIESFR